MAATSMKSAGKQTELWAREMVTCRSSSGWGSVSRMLRMNSGNSSRNKMP